MIVAPSQCRTTEGQPHALIELRTMFYSPHLVVIC